MLGMVHGAHATLQSKPFTCETISKVLAKIPGAQETAMSSMMGTILSERTKELDPGNKGFFTYPLSPLGKWDESLHDELKPLTQFITCLKFKMTTLRQSGRPLAWVTGQSHWTSNEHSTTS